MLNYDYNYREFQAEHGGGRVVRWCWVNFQCRGKDLLRGLFGHFYSHLSILFSFSGWSGGAMVLGKLPVPGRPTNLDWSRARAYCACSRCGWGLFGHFSLIYPFFPLSPSLWETARYRLKYCLKGPLSPKQPTNSSLSPSLWETVRYRLKYCLKGPLNPKQPTNQPSRT